MDCVALGTQVVPLNRRSGLKINQKYLWKFGGVGVSVLGLTVLMASGYQKLVGGASPTEAILKASGVQGGIDHEDQRKIQPDYFLPIASENL